MNFLRNMMGGHQRPLVETPATPQDNTLGLMHLRKLFADFRQPVPNMGQKELEDKLYNMLPLFCKVFGSAPSSDMTEKFGDILQFCSQVSRLMVSEIRRRASNQSTDAASCAIVKFLEIESTEESSNGWMLLSTINLLSTGADSLIDCMTAASLPSTLVKCLYLFFDLPHVDNADRLEPGCEFTPKERRVLLQKVFVQVLVRLCSHVSPAEELARKDDLTLLFSAITSWCPPHNIPWRKSAAEVLMTLSRHGLTPNVVQYIHSKGCVALCIDNMQRVQELSPIELVEMFVTVFCFLKDSSEVSQLLLDDFRSCQGYVFLSDFLLRMESDESEESVQALRNLVLLVGSLTTCGFIELKPSTTTSGSLFQMPGFTVPQPTGKGVSVRNLQAFHVLQTVFLKGASTNQCSTILDVISSIYHQDNANYFILEAQCTLSQFAERIYQKDPEVQNKFFELLEFIVFNLNYVPCKELISVSILIKTNMSVQCSQLCMRTLLKILRYHAVYKDVFREVGLLEVMVTCLHRYAALLKEPERPDGDDDSGDYYDDDLYDPEVPKAPLDTTEIPEPEQEMGFLVMEALAVLLNSNSQNAGVFRECGGARCAHNMVPFPQCRHQALNIVQQLVLSNGGEDDMGTLLGLMHTAPTTALELKTHILKSLLNVLRESHRTRIVFRKVGGFVYVMSVLVSMEGCLADPPKAPWDTAKRKDIITLLKTVFSTLTVAMRYEPANAKFFATEVRYASLTEAVRLLGCFSNVQDIGPVPFNLHPREETILAELFCNLKESRLKNEFPRNLVSACMMLRYLYDMALDNFDKPVQERQADNTSPSMKRISSVLETSTDPHDMPPPPSSLVKRNSTGSVTLSLLPPPPEPTIVHAGAVVSMLHLVPSIHCDDYQLALDLQWHTCEVLKSLVRSERNQQVMCEAGLPHELLSHANLTLADESHPLHPPIQYMFERLAAQCLTPKDLRDFIRLGDPLCCAAEEETDISIDPRCPSDKPLLPVSSSSSHSLALERRPGLDISKKLRTNGGAVPLTRVKCLVSMTTPRDVRLHGAAITPAFVELDLSAEGFGCLYLASIAPQGPPTPSVVGAGMIGGSDPGVVGGIGSGERLFPPQSGMTFSSWVCIDKFSSASNDPHPVRLLTIVRNIAGRDDNLICLSVYLAPRDRALFVSTQERHMPTSVNSETEMEPLLNNINVRFWCPELTQEGQWRHLVLLFNKAGIMKNSSVSLFVDGQHVSTQKLHYISPNLGSGGTASPNAATSVFAYLGTPPALRRPSRLVWRQGPCHLLEDIISAGAVQFIYQLGPNYVGSFQAPIGDKNEVAPAVISEDKIMFGVHAHAMSLMTIAKIRKVYNKVDAKSIAKQLGTSAHENATPIRILHNSAGHLSGPARSFGAILMGYLGVRTFCPRPVAKVILNVGGTSALLGLIAMATDVEGLYAAVKALVCVVRSNKVAQREMDRTRGYQTLAMLFTKKRLLLNSHILHLTFSLVGTVDSGRESTVIPNSDAFQDLLCNLEVWRDAPGELHRSLYEHLIELLTESSEQKSNLKLLQECGMVSKLLHVLRDPSLSHQTVQIIARILLKLLSNAHESSLLRYGQFLVSTLPAYNVSEKCIYLDENEDTLETSNQVPPSGNLDSLEGENVGAIIHNIQLRNQLLQILFKRLSAPPCTNGVNTQMVEDIQRVLGYDWLLLFMQGGIHQSTVILAMRMLVLMLALPAALNRFREGTSGGSWLDETECVLQNRIGMVLGFSLNTSGGRNVNREINTDVCHLPGFMALQWLLPKHADIPTLYFLQMALLMGQPIKSLPAQKQFDLDAVWTFIFGVPASQPPGAKPRRDSAKTEMCPEAAIVILAMIRAMLNQSQTWEKETTPEWLQEYPVTLMQFFHFLYHNQSEFVPLCMSGDFLCALAATLFPYRFITDSSSELSSPVEDFKPFPGSDSMVFVKMQDNVNVPHRRRPDDPMMVLVPNTRGNINPSLSNHPARKFVMDFMKTVVVDSLSLPQSGKTAPAIDLLLEASPEHATRTQRREFQTEILKSLMDHLLAADALLGDQAALPMATTGNYAHMASNIFYFTNRVVDKLWQGSYLRESKEVFDFVSKLIQQAKRKASGISLDGIYKGLNRVILYQLSRPMFSVSDQTSVLDALHKLTSNRGLVFGPGNYDQEFIGCLCYCLLQLTTEDPCAVSGNVHGNNYNSEPPIMRQTTWHMDAECESDPEDNQSRSADSSGNTEGFQLVANAAKRVWEELYVCKKPTIEEIFKVTLMTGDVGSATSSSPRISTPDLVAVRPQIMEAASRLWVTYYENERKCSYSHTERIQSQLQSKLQKVGHGVLRLATRKTKKDLPIKASPASIQDTNAWTLTHVSIVKDLVEFQYKQQQKSRDHMEKFLLEEWTQTETELMRERGLWGPLVGSELDKWMLDMTEGPHRMRKKVIRNDTFYIHYPYKEPDPLKPTKYKMAISLDSKKYFERYRSRSLVGDEAIPLQREDSEIDTRDNGADDYPEEMPTNLPCLLPRLPSGRFNNTQDEEQDLDLSQTDDPQGDGQGNDPQSDTEKTDNQKLLRLLEEGEKISHMFRCARIQGLDTMEGLLLFGKEHFYVVDGFTLLKTKEIADIDAIPADMHDPIIPKTSKGTATGQKRMCSKFAYEDIREVHKRRYLLQPIAIEVFSADGRNYLLAFPRKIRNKIYAKYLQLATSLKDNAHESVSGQKQSAKVEPGTGIISSLMGEKSVTQRWERGEISNFEYLMCLNTLAGRSYNDLMQYPVFPWIVQDYDSEELDLANPATFRDLSKPMGAQTPDRLKQFKRRYQDWDDPQGETPPYHYGTHYSSAMIVASFLVRMEPFTQHFLRLQGGHFDLADRMFHSVRECWLSASKHNMADVKELIPEFFYLPDFLCNSNNFDLGAKQSGVQLYDVQLPRWAKNDPREFIRAHREALECDFVSAHLHEWIDLIFGHKQQGPLAVDAINVFHHLFYEGNVDIYTIDDPLKKNATIGFINNFGQIPKQLFKKAHPQKKLNLRSMDMLPMGPLVNSSADRLFFHHLDNLKPTMAPIKELKGVVGQIIHVDKNVLAVEQNKVLIPPSYNKYLAWGFADLSIRIGNYDSDRANYIFENLDNGEILCAACPNPKCLITAGTSTVVSVWEYGKGKDKRALCLKQSLYGHTEPVTCLAASAAYNIILSGSRDRTCIIWDLSRLVFVRQLRGHSAPVAAVCINDLTGDMATCAGTFLHVWTVNGEEIATINTATSRNQQILCVSMSMMMEWDVRNVIMTGNSDGVVRMWSVEFVEVPDENYEKPKNQPQPLQAQSQPQTPQHQPPQQQQQLSKPEPPPRPPAPRTSPQPMPIMRPDQGNERSAAERVRDFNDPDLLTTKEVELGSSAESDGTPMDHYVGRKHHRNAPPIPRGPSEDMNDFRVVGTDLMSFDNGDDGPVAGQVEPAIDVLSEIEGKSLMTNEGSPAGGPNIPQLPPQLGHHQMPQQQVDGRQRDPSSPTNDFVFVTDNEVKDAMKSVQDVVKFSPHSPRRLLRGLREGFKWQRQLVFRSKLTMHTAFERKDNKDPAAITAIAVSKDHKTVYVGDAKGRIFSWSVTDQPGRVVADHWMKDEGVENCTACAVKFSFSERRHHCRNCGQLFCSKCSRFETEIRRLRILKPVRVCQACHTALRAQQAAEAKNNRNAVNT